MLVEWAHELYIAMVINHTHSGVHYSRAVSSDRVGNVADVDCVQMLVV